MRMSLGETIGFASFRYRGLQSRARYVNFHLALAYQTRVDSNDELPSHLRVIIYGAVSAVLRCYEASVSLS